MFFNRLIFGVPECQTTQLWRIFHESNDKLSLLNNGVLRHEYSQKEESDETVSYDYVNGHYCIDKVIGILKLQTDNLIRSWRGEVFHPPKAVLKL